VHVDDVLSSGNSFLKYSWKLGLGDERGLSEKLLLVVDATERGGGRNAQLTPVSLVITTEVSYVNLKSFYSHYSSFPYTLQTTYTYTTHLPPIRLHQRIQTLRLLSQAPANNVVMLA